MFELIIMRHAHAGEAHTDFARPLLAIGREEAKSVGQLFYDKKLFPDYSIISPAARTEETYNLVSSLWPSHPAKFIDQMYNGSINALMDALSECPESAKRVMLVAHNPGVSFLTEELSSDPSYMGFNPADWCHMQLDIESWQQIHAACGKIIDHA